MMTFSLDLSDRERTWYPVLETATARQHELAAGILQRVLEQWQESPHRTWVELAPDSPGESSYNVPALMWAGETWPLITIRTEDGVDAELWGVRHSYENLQRWRDRNEGVTQQWLEERGQTWDPTNTSCVNAESVIDGVSELLNHPDLAAIANAGTVGVLTVELDLQSLVRGRPELTVTSFTLSDAHVDEGLASMASTPERAPETNPLVFEPGSGIAPPPTFRSNTQLPGQEWGPPPPEPTVIRQALRDGMLHRTGLARARFDRVVNRLGRAGGRAPTRTTTHPEVTPPPSAPRLS